MEPENWAQILRDAALPVDSEPIVVKDDYAVARSISLRLVFRVGPRGARSFNLNPCDIGHAHRIAVDMAENGLNVLAPITRSPEVRGPYLVSVSPLATPLLDIRCSAAEATSLGSQFRAWAAYRSPLLGNLDIPEYVRIRARQALLTGGDVGAAGEWCLGACEALESQAPFSQLAVSKPGAIHGDVHPGNLVRHKGRVLLIDLDSVKLGPAMFDIAVGLMYERRDNRTYPGTLMASGYCHPTHQILRDDELIALQKWKEISSFSQLLLRWHQSPDLPSEFWQRTRSGWNDRWKNVVRTPTPGTREI